MGELMYFASLWLDVCSKMVFSVAVVNSLFNIPPIGLWGSMSGPCFVMNYLVSFLVLQ